MKRRDFLIGSGAGFGSLSMPAIVNAALCTDVPASAIKDYKQKDWLTIATVQNHLFPSEDNTPGALEINALRYLHNFLSNPSTDPDTVKFILDGSHLLQAFAKQQQDIPLEQLSMQEREKLLRAFEQQAQGRRWLSNILNYVLEALLTDPVYGGNPDGIGWQWLEHQAGEPRPPANKRYWLL